MGNLLQRTELWQPQEKLRPWGFWYGESKTTVSYKIYKVKGFIRRTEYGEINIQKSLNTVAELAIASESH